MCHGVEEMRYQCAEYHACAHVLWKVLRPCHLGMSERACSDALNGIVTRIVLDAWRYGAKCPTCLKHFGPGLAWEVNATGCEPDDELRSAPAFARRSFWYRATDQVLGADDTTPVDQPVARLTPAANLALDEVLGIARETIARQRTKGTWIMPDGDAIFR